MRSYDFSPLFRNSIGFDRMQRLLNQAQSQVERSANTNAYPPYNIESVGDDAYRISIAVAGFSEDDLDITVKENSLTVAGRIDGQEDGEYLHRGIAARQFHRNFVLAEGIEVVGAELDNGLLRIDLVRPQPAQRVRTVEIRRADGSGRRRRATKLDIAAEDSVG